MDYFALAREIDRAFSPDLATSLAGLSLAALAFFAPYAQQVIDKNQPLIDDLERRLDRLSGQNTSEEFVQSSGFYAEYNRYKEEVSDAKASREGIVKAFIFFSALSLYSLTGDRAIEESVLPDLNSIYTYGNLVLPDILLSYLMISAAALYLARGVRAIGKLFNVKFEDENRKLRELLTKVQHIDKK